MRMIHMFLVFFIVIVFTKCSDSDDTSFFYELVPVDKVTVPEQFEKGKKYTITVYYTPPTNCYSFVGLDTEISKNEQTIAVVNLVVNKNDCMENSELLKTSFEFIAEEEKAYIFKFWQGKQTNGNNDYLVIEVPIL
ncbi:hypothetical protein ABW636_13640 [Aquimarina sp. 2201CG1-2-11]|uniref:hypothetical protein n=1 Tax=Aquimarina discodermiae TaxID=3231043 RepID=UPI003462099C